jgi:hypothetical protein
MRETVSAERSSGRSWSSPDRRRVRSRGSDLSRHAAGVDRPLPARVVRCEQQPARSRAVGERGPERDQRSLPLQVGEPVAGEGRVADRRRLQEPQKTSDRRGGEESNR